MISTRRGGRVVAVASEAAIKASINDDNGAPQHSKAHPRAETNAIARTKGHDHQKTKVYFAKSYMVVGSHLWRIGRGIKPSTLLVTGDHAICEL